MKTYIKHLKKIVLLSLLLSIIQGASWASDPHMTYDTSLINGTTVNDPYLIFNFTLKYRDDKGVLQYKLPESVLVNDKSPLRYGNTYRVTLKEGKNELLISYQDGESYYFKNYSYYLDTIPPYVNVTGLYDHMMVDKRHVRFSIQAGDLQSSPESLEVHVYINDVEIEATHGYYQGVLKESPLLSYRQKEKTNDRHPTENIVKIVAKDAIGNESITDYHVISISGRTDYTQLRYLIEKAPGLLPVKSIYDNVGQYSEVGVALDNSNVTELGTYGGYVILGHDQPIFNGQGDDILVNGHWSNHDYPLTSIWVMKDDNNNRLPDDEWYYIDDGIESLRESVDTRISYSLYSIGFYKDEKDNNKRLVSQIPIRTPYSTPYYETAKTLRRFDFNSSRYTLHGNLNVFTKEPITSLYYNTKGYDLEDAYTLYGKAAPLDSVDFVKVYTNTLDRQVGIGSVMPAVNYVLARQDSGDTFACERDALRLLDETIPYEQGDLLKLIPTDWLKPLQFTQVKPQVNEDYVFVYPDEEEGNYLPFKREGDYLEVFYPNNRGTLKNVFLDSVTPESLDDLSWSQLMMQRYYLKNRLKYDDLSLAEKGQVELLDMTIDRMVTSRLSDAFSTLHNNYEALIHLKWQLDYLENELFNTWPKEDRDNLEKRLGKMLNYQEETYTVYNTLGQDLTVKATENVLYNLSREELERQINPHLKIEDRLKTDVTSIYSGFDISYTKADKQMTGLYRPIRYEISLPHSWSDTMHLYYVSKNGDIEVTVEQLSDNRITFASNQLGWFYITQE